MGKDKIEKGEALLNDDRFNKLFNDKIPFEQHIFETNSKKHLERWKLTVGQVEWSGKRFPGRRTASAPSAE